MSANFPELEGFDKNNLPEWLKKVRFDDNGLVMAICQDAIDQQILMVAWMDAASLFLTHSKNEMVFWSRSRKEYWHKGATSGNVLKVISFAIDCDGDALLFKVEAIGDKAACHTGRRSCFYRDYKDGEWVVNSAPLFDPKVVYGK